MPLVWAKTFSNEIVLLQNLYAVRDLVTTVPTWATGNPIAKLYQGIVASGADNANIPQPEALLEQVNENTLRDLSTADAQDLIPLGMRCLQTRSETIRRDGMLLLLGIALRSDSTVLMEPYIGDLGLIATNPTDKLKEGALYILGNTKPNISDRGRAFLIAHLSDSANSMQQRLLMATSLLKSPGSQPTVTIEKIVNFAENEPDSYVKAGILMQLGTLHTTDSHALEFIGASLSSTNPYLISAAVEATVKLDYEVRKQFVDKLTAIAGNAKNTSEVRSRALAVLREMQ